MIGLGELGAIRYFAMRRVLVVRTTSDIHDKRGQHSLAVLDRSGEIFDICGKNL